MLERWMRGTQRMLRIDKFTALLGALSVLGSGLIILRGVTYEVHAVGDAGHYLSAAQNLLEGRGFTIWNGVPYDVQGPLFPLIIAFVSVLGETPFKSAGYVNAAAFGLTIFAATAWLRCRVQSRFLVTWAGCTCALSLLLAEFSSWPWTEPLFVLFTVLSLFMLDRFLVTKKWPFLILSAICVAFVCLTRYIGIALLASALLILLLRSGPTFIANVRNIIGYCAIAGTPICLWMLRNFLNSETLTGYTVPTGFTPLGSIHRATSELTQWVIRETGSAYLNTWSETILGVPIIVGRGIPWSTEEEANVLGASLTIILLLLLAVGTGYALMRLRPPTAFWKSLTVPTIFISVYGLSLSIVLPLTEIELPTRYLAPIYVPVLIVVTLILNEFLRSASGNPPIGALTFLLRWIIGSRAANVSVSGLIMMCCVFLWLLPQANANYDDITIRLESARRNHEQFHKSEIRQYMKSHELDGYIWVNDRHNLYTLIGRTATWEKFRELPFELPDDARSWITEARKDGGNAYVVWRYYSTSLHYSYRYLSELLALPGLEVLVLLEDGFILKGSEESYGSARISVMDIMGHILGDNDTPEIRSYFDIYLREDKLIYMKSECVEEDIEPRFFLHLDPVDSSHIPRKRKQHGFDNLDFAFRDHGFLYEGWCIATRTLPNYDIAKIRTGQFTSQGREWEAELLP